MKMDVGNVLQAINGSLMQGEGGGGEQLSMDLLDYKCWRGELSFKLAK